MTQTEINAPSSSDIVEYYDLAGAMMSHVFGDHLHYGYWASDADDSTFGQAQDNLTHEVTRRLAARPGDRVLDIGCGTGMSAIQLARATGAHVTGISIHKPQVETAIELAAREGVSDLTRFEVVDALAMPYADGSFDAVYSIDTFEHLPRDLAYREVRRVLRDGGVLVTTEQFEHERATGERREFLDLYREGCAHAPYPLLDEFPPTVRAAGLRLLEFVDLSDKIARTLDHVAEKVRQDRAALLELFGEEAVAGYEAIGGGLRAHRLDYGLLTLKRLSGN